MSYLHPQPRAPSGRADLARLGLLALIALAGAMTLAWTIGSAPSGIAALSADGRQPAPGYPLRLALPSAELMAAAKLPALVEERAGPAEGDLLTPVAALGQTDPASTRPNPSDEPARPAPTNVRLKPGEFMPIDFKLAGRGALDEHYDGTDGSLTVTKPLFVDGRIVGPARIRIESGAQIYIATASVADALGDRATSLPRHMAGMLEARTGFVPFHELRAAGVTIEYDAASDRISLFIPS